MMIINSSSGIIIIISIVLQRKGRDYIYGIW